MCGIAGFVNFSSHKREKAQSMIRKMTSTIKHRGPDADGLYVDDYSALGHTRLSIIDVSSGVQPMGNYDNTVQIVFNGEIYNYLEIKRTLLEKGYSFRTDSDTEVILNSYIEWGEECVKLFNGMFAFAIWDSKTKTLFLARDRVGKKPLYYQWDGKTLSFASEIKALLAGDFSKKKIDPRALDCYFTFGYIPVPFSIFDDVKKLSPAHCLSVSNSSIQEKKYWNLNFDKPVYKTMGEACEEFESLLKEAVKCRLMSEVPLGAFLSSGLDSTLVVSMMAEMLDEPVKTNTIGFGDPEFCELTSAKSVANYFDTEHREFEVEPNASKIINEIAYYFDEPFADSSALPTWHVCRMAKKNVTVALSGDGGDEVFGGYTFRYTPHMLESQIKSKLPTSIRSLLFPILGSLYPASSKLPRYLRLKTIFENLSVSNAEAFYRDLSFLRPDHRKKIYSKHFFDSLKGFSPMETVIPKYGSNRAVDPVSKCQLTDINLYMTDDVLVKTDRMSMAHGLEVRNPLLDYRIIEFASKLPLELKLNSNKGKLLLRHLACSRLPQEIQKLPKKGFSIPAAKWLRRDLKSSAYEAIFNSDIVNSHLNSRILAKTWKEHQIGTRDHSVFLWGLMMLGLWEKEYFLSK